ncbi:MAG: DUF799 family lipoprotein [Desulfobacterales bacterium]|nr:DUF799 family lipoprotein [Desulfobacterales bacterium]
MKETIKISWAVFFLFIILYIPGCVASQKKPVVVPTVKKVFNDNNKSDPRIEKHLPRSVAILPFVDRSGSRKGSEIVRRGFYNHFSSLPYKDMELLQVDNRLRKAGLDNPLAVNKTSPKKLIEILKVDAVVLGSISNFDKLFAVAVSQVLVGAEVKMYGKDGNLLWDGKQKARIIEGGVSLSPIGIIANIVAASMNLRDVQLLRACDDLFRDMVKTIPVGKYTDAVRQPVISLLVQDTKGKHRKAGDEIRVVLKGDPGLQAWFDIGAFKKGIDMKEMEPGGYVGIYKVIPGDNTENAVITGYLSGGAGNVSRWVDALGSVTLDTRPPDTPALMNAKGGANVVTLNWKKNKEGDLSGYIIYRSRTPLSGYKSLGRTEFSGFKDKDAENLTEYFYKISAVDKAGNESSQSDYIKGMGIPSGPTHVSGTIDENTTWFFGSSPYIIDDTVVVNEKAALLIESGTQIISNGKGLVIRGGLIAKGEEKQTIIFEAVTKDISGKNVWDGIIFDNTKSKTNTLEFCRISQASVGVTCLSSSPEIRNSAFVGNNSGIDISGGFSKPEIDKCLIMDNISTGINISDGSEPLISDNRIVNNKKSGLLITNAGSCVISSNTIQGNQRSGIVVKNSQAKISYNNVYDNLPYNIEGSFEGAAVDARNNWWGEADWHKLFTFISGRVSFETILDGPSSKGKLLKVPVLSGVLGGAIESESLLTTSNSPYNVSKDIVIDNSAVFFIQPGVKLLFDNRTSIIVKDGGIVARGLKSKPIIFTSSGPTPLPGDYMNAVRFSKQTGISSFFKYCKFEYAESAIDIGYGMPEITHCHIVNNSQSGIRCINGSAPKILYCTIADNKGVAGIECRGVSKPTINHNNFIGNAVAVQAFSTIFIDARYNFWGVVTPGVNEFWGENINLKPWLDKPEKDCFEYQ